MKHELLENVNSLNSTNGAIHYFRHVYIMNQAGVDISAS